MRRSIFLENSADCRTTDLWSVFLVMKTDQRSVIRRNTFLLRRILSCSFGWLFILLISTSNISAHGGHIATFHYQIEANSIHLEFKIESDVLKHFDLTEKCPHYKAATAICLVQYINQNSSFQINGQEVVFEMLSSSQDEHFFNINLQAKGDFSACEQIKLENASFFEFDYEFENRIIVSSGDFEKSYRLNARRKKLEINMGT